MTGTAKTPESTRLYKPGALETVVALFYIWHQDEDTSAYDQLDYAVRLILTLHRYGVTLRVTLDPLAEDAQELVNQLDLKTLLNQLRTLQAQPSLTLRQLQTCLKSLYKPVRGVVTEDKPKFKVDEVTDAHGHWTIRKADGSPNGDTDSQPIATAYSKKQARRICEALNQST